MRCVRLHRYACLSLAVVLATACTNGFGQLDRQAQLESARCAIPPTPDNVTPPPGIYIDHGHVLDYSKLAPLPDPRRNVDMGYSEWVVSDPERLEQLYHDATRGNPQAAWFVCAFEPGVRVLGRDAARHLASLKCQTILSCQIRFQALPFSPDTASGVRIYELLSAEFQAEATRLQIAQSLVAGASLRPRSPPPPGPTPASRADVGVGPRLDATARPTPCPDTAGRTR